MFFGVLLFFEKLFLGNWISKWPAVCGVLYTLPIVLISFVIFNGEGLSGACRDLAGLFGFLQIPLWNEEAVFQLRNYGVILLLAAVGSTPLCKYTVAVVEGRFVGQKLRCWLEPAFLGFLLLCCTAFLVDGSFNPFLYFRF